VALAAERLLEVLEVSVASVLLLVEQELALEVSVL
jgi:hypothetical protein